MLAVRLRLRALRDRRIVAVPGDLAARRLGLSEDRWTDLAGSLDGVVYAGYLVNFPERFMPTRFDTTALTAALPPSTGCPEIEVALVRALLGSGGRGEG